MPEDEGQVHLLSGWGRTAPSRAELIRPRRAEDVAELVASARGPLIARGLGRSYGDAAQCAGGRVLDMTGLDHIGPFGSDGTVTVGSGTSLQDLMARGLPEGWFVPVTPGTRQVTLGGAVAADIHGKNHHVEGSFGRHVTRLRLATPSGELEVSPEDEAEVFWATAGGMGLTGVVTEATVRMLPVETSWLLVDTERLGDLEAVMAEMERRDATAHYSVAWLDCTVTGRHLGRGVVTVGEHAPAGALGERQRARAREVPGDARLAVPPVPVSGLLNRLSIRAFNELWFHKAPRSRQGELQPIGTFFHPLDGVAGWNHLYGPRGFVQYQLAVGPDQGETVRRAVTMLAEGGAASFLTVLKRFGEGTPGPLSFPLRGWTLALDIPVGAPGLPPLLDRLDDLVVEAGGRVYLAKDARLRPELLNAMYPRLDELSAVRDRLDPRGVLESDLARRLGLSRPPVTARRRRRSTRQAKPQGRAGGRAAGRAADRVAGQPEGQPEGAGT